MSREVSSFIGTISSQRPENPLRTAEAVQSRLVGTTTRAIALVGAVGVVVLVLALALAPRDAPRVSPAATGSEGPTATIGASATDGPPATHGGSQPTATLDPGATEGPAAVLVGAGDIAECTEGGDAETADLVEAVDGIVFTLGDNAYEDGTFAEFQD
jgi:hypothetical protein